MKRKPALGDYVRAAFEDASGAAGSICLDESRAMEFYGGRLDPREEEAVREHLLSCAKCRELAADARRCLDAFTRETPDSAQPVARPRFLPEFFIHRRRLLILAAATLLITVGTVLSFRQIRTQAPLAHAPLETISPERPRMTADLRWQGLTIERAPYTPSANAGDDLIWRGGQSAPTATHSRFDAGMKAYLADDFVQAERALAEHLATHPSDGEAAFYRGVSLLMLGRPAEAAISLEVSLSHSTPNRADDIHWYIALAHLKSGQPGRAADELAPLAAGSGPHARQASELLAEAREYPPVGAK